MGGIYIHIPFCKSRCIYCGFYSTTLMNLRQRYVDAVCCEIIRRKEMNALQGEQTVSTIYLGGGTPSQLTMGQTAQLLESIYNIYNVESDAEVTIEVNPDDVTIEFADHLRQLPVNRVSMGAQTFDDQRLRFLHRRHSGAQVAQAVERLRRAGIGNISVDLMYGFPGETPEQWLHDIDTALALGVEHLSAYCLMIEEGTALFEKIKKYKNKKIKNLKTKNDIVNGESGEIRECDEEVERAMYYALKDRLEAAGYEHYEISNFARPGRRSRHNSSYWTGIPYLGLGAAAHSFDGKARQWNVSDIRQYIEAVERGLPVAEHEELDDDTLYNDRVAVALRTREGLDLNALAPAYRNYCRREARKWIDHGLLRLQDSRLALTREGLFVSDMVMADLMMVK